MADLKLPDIEPVGPIVSTAGAIDRAGAQFKQAADAVGQVSLDYDMAQVATQMQEAELQTVRGATRALDLIKSNPYLKPEQVEELFGGNVPPGINIVEPEAQPDGTTAMKRREVIPMHEVAPLLIDRTMTATVENASRGIEAPGWKAAYQRRAAAAVEKVRAEALDWRRSQSLADAQIKSVAQYEQYMAMGAWDAALGILDNATWTMDVQTRETLRAAHAGRRAAAEVDRGIRDAQTPAELDALAREVGSNRQRASEGEPGLFAPLKPDDQAHFLRTIEAKRKVLIAAAYDQTHAAVAAPLVNAMDLPPGQRRDYLIANWKGAAGKGLKPEDAFALQAKADALMKGEDVKTNWRVFSWLAENDWQRLLPMSRAEVDAVTMSLAEAERKHVIEVWGKGQEGGKTLTFLNDEEKSTLNLVLDKLELDGGKDASVDERLRREQVREELQSRFYRLPAAQKEKPLAAMMRLGVEILKKAPKGGWGTTGYTNVDPEVALTAEEALKARGKPFAAADVLREVDAFEQGKGEIESIWNKKYPDRPKPTTTEKAQVFYLVTQDRDRMVREYRRFAPPEARDAGGAAPAEPDKATLIDFVIDRYYSTPEQRKAANVQRVEMATEQDNAKATARAREVARKNSARRMRMLDLYQRHYGGKSPEGGAIPSFEDWYAMRGGDQ